MRRRDGRNCAQCSGAKIIAPSRAPITAVSVRGQAGNGTIYEECFCSDAKGVRMAKKPVAVVTVPPSVFIDCLPCLVGTSCCER